MELTNIITKVQTFWQNCADAEGDKSMNEVPTDIIYIFSKAKETANTKEQLEIRSLQCEVREIYYKVCIQYTYHTYVYTV
jgi:hypothetical protein